MTPERKEIIALIKDISDHFPELRFGQLLFNLKINEFADKENPGGKDFLLRDIYQDSDNDILERMRETLHLNEDKGTQPDKR